MRVSLLCCALISLSGCASFLAMADGCEPKWTLGPCKLEQPKPARPKSMSWDQENLHNLGKDVVCPAQYDAPNGNLRQCIPQ